MSKINSPEPNFVFTTYARRAYAPGGQIKTYKRKEEAEEKMHDLTEAGYKVILSIDYPYLILKDE